VGAFVSDERLREVSDGKGTFDEEELMSIIPEIAGDVRVQQLLAVTAMTRRLVYGKHDQGPRLAKTGWERAGSIREAEEAAMEDNLSPEERQLVDDYREIRAIGEFYGYFAAKIVENLKKVLLKGIAKRRRDRLKMVAWRMCEDRLDWPGILKWAGIIII
jgi:hypothetical protein